MPRLTDDDQETIRARAYELYRARGDGPGSALDDWLAAERQVHGEPPAPDA